jgi:DNA modification methylase
LTELSPPPPQSRQQDLTIKRPRSETERTHIEVKQPKYSWQRDVFWTENQLNSSLAKFIQRMPDPNVMATPDFVGYVWQIEKFTGKLEDEIRFNYIQEKIDLFVILQMIILNVYNYLTN